MAQLEDHSFEYGAEVTKRLFYHATGPVQGPLLIFIHGWPAIGKTWKAQLQTFASLGFRCVAPDMPGYGRSTARKVIEDYSQEEINTAMLELLNHVKREKAVWIGHDWGAPAVWSFAEQFPWKCVGVVGIAIPAHVFESGGLEAAVETVDRDLYPADKYPYGQWDYQRFYELEFEKATKWFESDSRAILRVFYTKGDPSGIGKPAATATTVRDGGWRGGGEKPDPAWKQIPSSAMCIDEELYEELVTAMETTGWYGADAWYMNHARNKEYFEDKAENEGFLHMPTLFIEGKYDHTCSTGNSTFADAQRKYCTDLTEVRIACGHWIPQEKPAEVNAAIARWLVQSCTSHWPGFWSAGYVTNKARPGK